MKSKINPEIDMFLQQNIVCIIFLCHGSQSAI